MAFSMPPDWTNDERMNFLFQPFKPRAANPVSYDSKLRFWRELIQQFLQFEAETTKNPRMTVTQDELRKLFKRNGKMPACLGLVIESLVTDGTLMLEDDIRCRLQERVTRRKASWTSWSYQVMIGSPLKKFTDKVQSLVSERPSGSEVVYSVPENVKRWALRLLSLVRDQSQSGLNAASGLLLSRTDACTVLKGFDSSDVQLLLSWLEAEGMAGSVACDDEYLYKFTDSKASHAQQPTEVELGIWKLKRSRSHIAELLKKFQQEINELNSSIRQQLREKNKHHALMLLKKRKAFEKKYDINSRYLLQLEDVLDEIYHSETSQMVLQAYQSGTKALKAMHKPTAVKQAQETMDELSEAAETSKEVTDIISGPGSIDTSDDDDLERELNDLLKDSDNSSQLNVDELISDIDGLVVHDSSFSSESHQPVKTGKLQNAAMNA